jgi:hypothetical protein
MNQNDLCRSTCQAFFFLNGTDAVVNGILSLFSALDNGFQLTETRGSSKFFEYAPVLQPGGNIDGFNRRGHLKSLQGMVDNRKPSDFK